MAVPDYTKPTTTVGALPAAEDPSQFSATNLQAMAGAPKEAEAWNPDENALVAGQLGKLLSSSSDYMSRARSRALQFANDRGLANSSLAATAGEAAAIDAALPIAQQDAQTYGTAQKGNVDTRNQFAMDANRFGREGALAAQSAGYEAGRQKTQNAFTAGESAAERSARESEFGRELDFRRTSFDREAGQKDRSLDQQDADLAFRTNAQNQDNAVRQAQLSQELQRSFMDARLQLETTPNLDKAGKARAIDAMSAWFYESAMPAVRAALGNPASWPAAAPSTGGRKDTPTSPREDTPSTPPRSPLLPPAWGEGA